jgi:hypothetical protein
MAADRKVADRRLPNRPCQRNIIAVSGQAIPFPGGQRMGLQVGQKAPDFTLPSHLDMEVTLSTLRGKNVLLAFFPLAWTPV